jgi:hypothetical protein
MVAFTAGAVLTAANLNTAFNTLTFRAVTGTSDTLVLADNGGAVSFSNASPITATVPPFSSVAYANGTVIQLLNLGAGVVTVTAGVGVTLNGSTVTLAQNAGGTLIKTATNTWYFLTNPVAKVLQVVQVYKDDVFSTTSTSFVDVTGLSVSITPSSATSKVLVIAKPSIGGSEAGSRIELTVLRTATAIGNASTKDYYSASLASRTDAPGYTAIGSNLIHYLDSPATTSATTYKIQMRTSTGTGFINRAPDNDLYRGTSDLTLMEISA